MHELNEGFDKRIIIIDGRFSFAMFDCHKISNLATRNCFFIVDAPIEHKVSPWLCQKLSRGCNTHTHMCTVPYIAGYVVSARMFGLAPVRKVIAERWSQCRI